MRDRSYSYSPSPPRGYGRRGRSPSPCGRYGGRRDPPTSLLVRNLRRDCRQEDLRRPFGQFGQLKDIYLPRDYYTGEPRGFGFVQYVDPADAAEAKYQMDGQILLGRELTVVFAEENRKKPADMRARERVRHDVGRRVEFMITEDLLAMLVVHHVMQDLVLTALAIIHLPLEDGITRGMSLLCP
ncbi:Arginine/serine-rich splicing factor scl25a transcript I [Asimina triloba]